MIHECSCFGFFLLDYALLLVKKRKVPKGFSRSRAPRIWKKGAGAPGSTVKLDIKAPSTKTTGLQAPWWILGLPGPGTPPHPLGDPKQALAFLRYNNYYPASKGQLTRVLSGINVINAPFFEMEKSNAVKVTDGIHQNRLEGWSFNRQITTTTTIRNKTTTVNYNIEP